MAVAEVLVHYYGTQINALDVKTLRNIKNSLDYLQIVPSAVSNWGQILQLYCALKSIK